MNPFALCPLPSALPGRAGWWRRRIPRAGGPARLAIAEFLLFARALRRQALSLVEPRLDANLPVGRARLGESVIDVRAQRLQRKLSVQIPFGARDFGAVQAAGHAHFDA